MFTKDDIFPKTFLWKHVSVFHDCFYLAVPPVHIPSLRGHPLLQPNLKTVEFRLHKLIIFFKKISCTSQKLSFGEVSCQISSLCNTWHIVWRIAISIITCSIGEKIFFHILYSFIILQLQKLECVDTECMLKLRLVFHWNVNTKISFRSVRHQFLQMI